MVVRTDGADGLEGHGFAFTIGRGNDVQVAAITALSSHLVGRDVESDLADMGDLAAPRPRLSPALARP
jgi:L-fuconate dehydratase